MTRPIETTTQAQTPRGAARGHCTPRTWRRVARLVAMVAVAAVMAPAAVLAVPAQTTIEGVLSSTGGVPAADGAYKVSFAIYGAQTGGTAVWSEGPVDVQVSGGRFHHRLGSVKPLDATALAALTTPFLGVTVGADPELPRRPVDAAPYALLAGVAGSLQCSGCVGSAALGDGVVAAAKVGFNYAASTTKGGPALDLSCTGCVSVAELAFDGDVDLGGNSLKAKNVVLAGDLTAKTVTATAFVGDGSKLSGIALPTGSCAEGQAVVGVGQDGKLVCKGVSATLPADGLNEVSNNLMTNQFQDVVTAKDKAVAIPDNTGADGVSELIFPDIGTAQSITFKLTLSNTDLSTVSIVLLPPDDKKVGYTVCDPCGDKDAKALSVDSSKSAFKSGDLKAWIGANPKGLWTLKVKDSNFCLPQAPGNATLCDPVKKTDGVLTDWSIGIGTLSNQKVQVDGRLLVRDGLTLQTAKPGTMACDDTRRGTLYWDGSAIQVCTAAGLYPISVGLPGSEANPASSCKDVRDKVAGAKTGSYWIDPDGFGGAPSFQVECNMDVAGGGWTKVSEYAETSYANLAERHSLAYQDVLILEVEHGVSPPLVKSTVTNQTCYTSPKKGFHSTAAGGPHCDTGIQVRIGGTGGSCGDSENGCFGIYKGATVFGDATGCNWDCTPGAVTVWGKGYSCNGCRCRNTPSTTTAACGNGANGGAVWGTLRHWILVR